MSFDNQTSDGWTDKNTKVRHRLDLNVCVWWASEKPRTNGSSTHYTTHARGPVWKCRNFQFSAPSIFKLFSVTFPVDALWKNESFAFTFTLFHSFSLSFFLYFSLSFCLFSLSPIPLIFVIHTVKLIKQYISTNSSTPSPFPSTGLPTLSRRNLLHRSGR